LELEDLRQGENEAQTEVGAIRSSVASAQAESSGLEARLDGIAMRRADAERRLEQLEAEREQVLQEIEMLRVRRSTLERTAREALEGKEMTTTERQALEAELATLRASRVTSEREVDAAKTELNLKRSRLKVLQDLHRRLEGVGQGARALMSGGREGVLGLVADRIEARAEHTVAFASLLGERLQYVVVSDPERGLGLLDELRSSGRGRGHVIAARPSYIAGSRAPLDPELGGEESGILGYLADYLRYDPSDAPLVASLVGDAILTESAELALKLVRQDPKRTAVSLDGTVVRPEGTISGGAGDDVAAAMVEQKREMHELSDETARLDATLAAKVDDFNTLLSRVTDLETALEQARQRAHAGDLAHVTAERDLKSTASDLDRAERRQESLLVDTADVRTSLLESTETERESMDQLEVLRQRLAELRVQSGDAELRLSEWRERVAGKSALVTERKVRLAQLKEQTEAARSAIERIAAQGSELEARKGRLAIEAQETARAIGEAAARIYQCRERRLLATEQSRLAHEELSGARSELESVRSRLSEREGEMREFRVALAEVEDAARENEMALQRVQMNLEHVLASVKEKFRGLDLTKVVGDYHKRSAPDAEHKRRIEELTQAIDRIGPVNLDAAREFEESEKRYHDLNNQKIDIELALVELDKAIKHMDKESKSRFKETFDAVNELFKKTFVKNFRGGRAELRLTDPDDLLLSGVDIMAQPPGKKLGNIELMSGGEKALTAVSLIFAIFQHRPSPFCVLDEVDAPLDEANVSRYNEAIRSMTANSQFILITHIRKTMQSVDVLYGVTMGEPGVSRLVSVKVNDGASSRSEALQASRGEVIGADSALSA
jgi:chromosome segregation protein